MAEKEFPEIKKQNKGKFTKWVKKNMQGKSTCEAASSIMSSKDSYPNEVVEMANYANNFGCKKEKKSPAKRMSRKERFEFIGMNENQLKKDEEN